jgi:molybdate transport system substrate-binding protein
MLFVLPNSDIDRNLRRLTPAPRGSYHAGLASARRIGGRFMGVSAAMATCFRIAGRLWIVALVAAAVVGCVGNGPGSIGGDDDEAVEPAGNILRIAAASDLQSALPKIAERFTADTGIKTTLVFGASGQLTEQITRGAPFDVFLCANESFVQSLANDGIIKPESVHPYAQGSLVLAVYHKLGDRVSSLADLAKPEVKKIAVAFPAVAPYGKAATEAIERAGLKAKLEPKIVFAESVRQALFYTQRGNAEAAFVGRAIADVPEIKAVAVDPKLYNPIVQALGVVRAAARPAEADRFTKFVLGDDGQAILKQFGFSPPPPANQGKSQTVVEKHDAVESKAPTP